MYTLFPTGGVNLKEGSHWPRSIPDLKTRPVEIWLDLSPLLSPHPSPIPWPHSPIFSFLYCFSFFIILALIKSHGYEPTSACYPFSFNFHYYVFHYLSIFRSNFWERIQSTSSFLSQNMSHIYEFGALGSAVVKS